MSLLPERKKSADEIAKLREALGIGGVLPPPAAPEAEVPQAIAPALAVDASILLPEPIPVRADPVRTPVANVPQEPKPVRSLKRAERLPGAATRIENAGRAASTNVHSLRKSELQARPAEKPPAKDSKLPNHRHSDHELHEIRRREALGKLGTSQPPPRLAAHLSLILTGYICAAVSAIYFWFFDIARQEMWVTAVSAGIAISIAGFVYFYRPFSRHHAAFIAVVALLAAVFGALYYFPQFQHGT